ncbi:MAG TPA: AAA domain-containing protein, partial [Polyangium sp.]|nr:AAA domain-containing protein [Polyangium sp.]
FPDEPIVELDDRAVPNEFTLGVARAVIGTVAQIEKVESALPLATTVMRIHDGALPSMQRRINARASRESKEPTNHRKHARRRKKAEPIWSAEMSWRIVRDYELRMLPEILTDSEGNAGQADVYRREMDLLLPKGDLLPRVQDDVGQVRRVALPSILESLQVGFDHARAATGRMAWNNVLAYGLPKEEVLVHRLVRLQYQHRMHPEISAFAQRRFYARDDLLKDPPNMAELRPFSYPHYAGRSIWLDVQGQETPSPIRNEKEADVIIEELGKLEAWASTMHREKPWSVAILTFYRGQERYLREKLRKLTDQHRQSRHFVIKQRDRVLLEIELCTVDRYQGHEADIVFLSFVRTEAPGFLNSPNRLNVAVTRARYQLVLVGDRSFLERQKNKAPVCAWLAADMKRLNRVDLRY